MDKFFYRIILTTEACVGTTFVQFDVPICGANAVIFEECLEAAKKSPGLDDTFSKVEDALNAFELQTGIHGEFAEDIIAGEFNV